MATAEQIKAATQFVIELCDEMVSGINACPTGVPAGVLYATLMSVITLDQFNAIMSALVKGGRIRQQGHLYLPAAK